MSELLRLAPAVTLATDVLGAPGFLRGPQRGGRFRSAAMRFVEHVLRRFTRWKVAFPLCLRQTSAMLGVSIRTMRTLLAFGERLGLIKRVGETQRRYEAKTKSPTEGSTHLWYCPGLYELGDRFAKLFPDLLEIGPDLAPSPFENHSDTYETPNVRGRISTEEAGSEEGIKLSLRVGLNTSMAEVAPIDGVNAPPGVDPAIWEATRHLRTEPAPLSSLATEALNRRKRGLWYG